jgi:hypothetical protein
MECDRCHKWPRCPFGVFEKSSYEDLTGTLDDCFVEVGKILGLQNGPEGGRDEFSMQDA